MISIKELSKELKIIKSNKEIKLIQEDINLKIRPHEKPSLNPEIDSKPSSKLIKKKNAKSRNKGGKLLKYTPKTFRYQSK